MINVIRKYNEYDYEIKENNVRRKMREIKK